MTLACILDVEAERLTRDEKAFFREVDPWALILFQRSCVNRAQMQALTSEIRDVLGRNALIFIDQEGGRVSRMAAPEWRELPPLETYGALYLSDREAAYEACVLHHRIIAHDLREVGVTADCAPCLDLRIEGADAVIGERALSSEPAIVGALGRAAMEGLHRGGVASVIKHIPGHGRAEGDSHFVLPRVAVGRQALAQDIAPFIACADAPMAMTAHVLYDTFDEARPATQSPRLIQDIIRGEIGFDGLLMSDDASMKALTGPLQERADKALKAGCDVVMLCNASLDDRLALAAACPTLSGKALARAQVAEKLAGAPDSFDVEAGWARFRALLEQGKKAA
jgi:beta-N-acetylhexosaminidase